MQRRTLLLLAFLLIGLLLPAAPAVRGADAPDYAIPGGHFYTQANGQTVAAYKIRGYAITDADGIPFWTWFQRLGGVANLGYPASHRFLWNGFWVQVCQKVVLQWRPETQTVAFVNVFDEFNIEGKDAFLQAARQVPPIADWSGDAGQPWNAIVARHLALLNTNAAIKARYMAVADPVALYGLPMAPILDTPDAYVLRAQRVVIQQWKKELPWAHAGQVTIANGGDIAKELGLAPAWSIQPASNPADPADLTLSQDTRRVYFWLQNSYLNASIGPIYSMNLDGSDLQPARQQLQDRPYIGLTVLPDGSLVYLDANSAGHEAIMRLPPGSATPVDWSGLSQTINGGGEWTANRSTVAVIANANHDIYLISQGGQVKLSPNLGSILNVTPTPDGTRLAVLADAGGQLMGYDLNVIRTNGSGPAVKVAQRAAASTIKWSPDGNWIAYSEYVNGTYRVHVVHPDGSGDKVLLSAGSGAFPQSWSSDSNRLLVTASQSDIFNQQLYLLNVQSGATTQLVGAGVSESVWVPGSETVLYVRQHQIWRINSDGSGNRLLTTFGR